MNLIFKLAWRNIWRNWRRSLFTIAAVTFAVILSVVMRSMQKGTYKANIKTTVELFSGYLQVQKEGFMDSPSLSKSFKVTPGLNNILKNNPLVKSYSKRITSNGLVGFKHNSVGAIIFGLNPEVELKVTKINERVNEGRFISSDNIYDITVGYKMLKNIGANIGDTVVILTSGFDGSMGNAKFRIAGTMKMGQQEFDGMAVFMHIDAASRLMAMHGRVSYLAIALNKLSDIPQAQQSISSKLPAGLIVLSWDEFLPSLKQQIELDNHTGILYLGILVMVVAFGILNTLLMSISERYKEFGIMLALGTSQKILVKIVLLETVFILLMGEIIGNVIAWGVNYYFYLNPIILTGDMVEMYEEYGFIPALYFTMDAEVFINSSVIILIVGLITFLYPAYRLFKLEALKGIRYT